MKNKESRNGGSGGPILNVGSSNIRWADDAEAPPIEHVRVNHGCIDVTVTEQLLDRPDVVTALQKMSRETVTKRMAGRVFRDSGLLRRASHRFLDDRLIDVAAAPWSFHYSTKLSVGNTTE